MMVVFILLTPTTFGTYTITYTYASNLRCPDVILTDTIIFEANCAKPLISQVFAGENEGEMYIEVKNRYNNESIEAGQFYLNYYADSQILDNTTSSFDIGTFAPLEVKVFKKSLVTPYAYYVSLLIPTLPNLVIQLPYEFNFNGGENNILTLSTFNKKPTSLRRNN